MFDMSQVQKMVVRDASEFAEIMDSFIGSSVVGLDIETSGLDFTGNVIAGISLYSPKSKVAIYVPINHPGKCVHIAVVVHAIRHLLRESEFVMHNASFDMINLIKEGCRFNKVYDTFIAANKLQMQSLGLKDVAATFSLMDPRQLVKFEAIIAKAFGINPDVLKGKQGDELLSKHTFNLIDLDKCPEAVDYAVNDAILVAELKPLIHEALSKHMESTPAPAEEVVIPNEGVTQNEFNPFAKE